jgi:predicted dithiol-disulfide oxidoreductase (DUF899 family)
MDHRIVSRSEWLDARRAFVAKEKEFDRMRDKLSRERRDLPWERVEKAYVFDGPNGRESLADLFAGKSQLIVYHFMFAPDWEEGCKSCSFWADNFERLPVHLKHRDATLIAVSRAPLKKLDAYANRLGWTFKWVSSGGNDFNHDYHVSFAKGQAERAQAEYNFGMSASDGRYTGEEFPGISVFYKNKAGEIFHTYSCYARGIDMMNNVYHYLDLTPKGRDEGDGIMAWLRRNDEYKD